MEKSWTMFIGGCVGLAIAFVLIIIMKTDRSMKCKYDERQELIRGRGFKYGFFSIIGMTLIFACFREELSKIMDTLIQDFAIVMVGLIVYVVYCIWNDAYFALNESKTKIAIIFFAIAVVNIILCFMQASVGNMFVNGRLEVGGIHILDRKSVV